MLQNKADSRVLLQELQVNEFASAGVYDRASITNGLPVTETHVLSSEE